MSRKVTSAMAVSSAAMMLSLYGPAAHAQAPAPAPAQASQLSEVIVTAQRRSERLNEVPIAMSVQNAAQLERAGATNIRDLTVLTPGLLVSGTGANLQPAIRGIHSEQVDPGNDANVAIYLDGVYQSNPLANNLDLPDVQQIEVLKGPQGTLFGRNATGGALRITTRRPSFTPTGQLDASYGKLDEVSVKGFVSGPISGDAMAASLTAFYIRRDGFSHDIIKNKTVGKLDNKGVRAKLLLKPTEALDILLAAGYSDRHDENAMLYEPYNGNTIGRVIPGSVLPTKPRDVSDNSDRVSAMNAKVFQASSTIDWRLDAGTLTSTTAVVRYRTFYDTNADTVQLDLLSYPIWVNQRDVSQELSFASRRFGMFQLVAGGFYFDGDGRYDPLKLQGVFLTPTLYGYMQQKTKAVAAFTEVTINPIEPVNIILGARYSEEKRHATGNYFLAPDRPPVLPELGRAKFTSFTPRASIRYTLPSDDNVYFTYSRGFKSGGFNLSGLSTSPFKPEKVDAFEIGLKTSPRRMISGNFSAFWYKYKDQQVQSAVNNLNVTSNAASSKIKGVDAEVQLRPIEPLTVSVVASYLDAKFDAYPNAVFNLPTGGVACRCGNTTTIGDLSGGREPLSPKWTFGATAAYRTTMDAGALDLSANLYHTSRFYYDVNARVSQPAYTTLAARAAFTPTGTKVTVYAYGRNLTNKRYINNTFVNNLADGVTWAPPRTYGVGAKYEF